MKIQESESGTLLESLLVQVLLHPLLYYQTWLTLSLRRGSLQEPFFGASK